MDDSEQRSDEELLDRTAVEPEAFGAFYRRHVANVLAFFYRWRQLQTLPVNSAPSTSTKCCRGSKREQCARESSKTAPTSRSRNN
jgi:hypothetical protein